MSLTALHHSERVGYLTEIAEPPPQSSHPNLSNAGRPVAMVHYAQLDETGRLLSHDREVGLGGATVSAAGVGPEEASTCPWF